MNSAGFLIFALEMCFLQCAYANHFDCERLKISIDIKIENEDKVLFTIKNIGNDQVQISGTSLPWEIRDSISFFPINAQTHLPYEGILPPEDRFSKPLNQTIKAGLQIQGVMDLNRYIFNLNANLAIADAIVFWYFEPIDVRGEKLDRCAGWLFLERKRTTKN